VRLSRGRTGIVGAATAAVEPCRVDAGPGKNRGGRVDRGGALSGATWDRVVYANRDRGLGEALPGCGEACEDDQRKGCGARHGTPARPISVSTRACPPAQSPIARMGKEPDVQQIRSN